jgi:non-canonical (house-cleaning) NTP pyrophosphatase
MRALSGEVIRVGTENSAKLGAVRSAIAPFASDGVALAIEPCRVASDVPEQPIGWAQIVAGARNRARAAFAFADCAIAVGIEDGLARLSDEPESEGEDLQNYFNVGCAWVTDGEIDGHGFSSGFAYPNGALVPAIRDQAPIGDLFDDHWSRNRPAPEANSEAAKNAPSSRGGGNIGRLTGGRLERAAYGSQAVSCALIRFLHTDLYD